MAFISFWINEQDLKASGWAWAAEGRLAPGISMVQVNIAGAFQRPELFHLVDGEPLKDGRILTAEARYHGLQNGTDSPQGWPVHGYGKISA